MPEEVIQLVPFRLDTSWCALPLERVECVLPYVAVTRLPGAPPVALGAINVRGEVVAVVCVRERLGLPSREAALSDRLLLARTSRRRLALAVDEVMGVFEVGAAAVHRADSVFPGARHVKGVATVPEGLLLVQDLDEFLSLQEETALAAALESNGW